MKINIYELVKLSLINPRTYPDVDFIKLNKVRLDLLKRGLSLEEIVIETQKRFLNKNLSIIKIPYIFYHYLYIVAKLLKDKEAIHKIESTSCIIKIINERSKLIKSGMIDFIEIETVLKDKFTDSCELDERGFYNSSLVNYRNLFNFIINYYKSTKRGRKCISESKKKESKLKNKVVMREKMKSQYEFVNKIKSNLLSEDEYTIIKKCLERENVNIDILEKIKNFKFK
jgi:hypothetical protein